MNLEIHMHYLAVILLCLQAGVGNGRTEEDQSSISNTNELSKIVHKECFYQESTECPSRNRNNCPCKKIIFAANGFKGNASLCCNVNSETLKHGLSCAGFSQDMSHLHIRNSTFDAFDLGLVSLNGLKSLAITDGSINRIRGHLNIDSISCLNFSNNAMVEIENNSLIQLTELNTLDLSYNNLTHLPGLDTNHELWLDISGIRTLPCHDIYQYINKTGEKEINFNRENETYCAASTRWNWFNTTERIPLAQLQYFSLLQTECPKGDTWQCHCYFERLDLIEGKPPTLAVHVDCSGLQLTELPDKLPRNTRQLNVSYNNITILDSLSTNRCYEDLREFYADYNNISSINKLEGSKFLDNYFILSLRYNKIKSLPTYILSPATDENYQSSRLVKLGGNQLYCDCNTAKYLKGWLQTRILDSDEVLCENVKEKVIDLEPSKMCVYPGDWTDYIYYIIATEIVLLISLIAKVSYDYWIFKTAGYLPWPANKMPKLPCDWLCET